MAIYTVRPGVYFGELPDRTQNTQVSWGFLMSEGDCEVALGNDSIINPDKAATQDDYDTVRVYIQNHIKSHLDKYDRMNEIFNLQIANDNRNRVIRADPRRARTFLALHKNALLPEMMMKVQQVDIEFSHVENLLTGEADIFADANLYLINIANVAPIVCYYVSGILTHLDRLRLLQENTRRESEKF